MPYTLMFILWVLDTAGLSHVVDFVTLSVTSNATPALITSALTLAEQLYLAETVSENVNVNFVNGPSYQSLVIGASGKYILEPTFVTPSSSIDSLAQTLGLMHKIIINAIITPRTSLAFLIYFPLSFHKLSDTTFFFGKICVLRIPLTFFRILYVNKINPIITKHTNPAATPFRW